MTLFVILIALAGISKLVKGGLSAPSSSQIGVGNALFRLFGK